ncbi:hypothetical protein NPIL_425041 [Nephila pilipes]|uniref:FATC domain-containing protein n=1 Tax=Nephila pilipes TaxID=299642 RepID=A0A8X6T596_NEPPI|nr:hypothetical protein NPIL_425041 [Nephila pilipes]
MGRDKLLELKRESNLSFSFTRNMNIESMEHEVLGLPSQTVGFALCTFVNHLGYDLSAEIELRDVGVENKTPAEDILRKACERCVSENFLGNQMPTLSTFLGAFDTAWRKDDLSRRLERHSKIAKASQSRAQSHLTSFQWLNEDLLMQGNIGVLQSPPVSSRTSIMAELRKAVSNQGSLDIVVTQSQDRYLGLASGIEQRLKWAAGANPSLSTVQEEFEAAIAIKTALINSSNQVSSKLASVCSSILHFEARRTKTSEALSSDSVFLALINRCKETCELAESCHSQISDIEEHLIALQPLDKDGVTTEWLTSVIKKVSQSLSSCREKLEQQKTVANTCWESLHHQVAHVHDLISVHHKLMSDVRHILRNLAKYEEQELGVDFKTEGHIHRYMSVYKEFSERISAIVSKLLAEAQNIDVSCVMAVEAEIPVLSVSALEIYNQLLELAGPLGNRKHGLTEAESSRLAIKKNRLSPMYEPSLALSPAIRPKTPRGGTPKKSAITRDPRTGKAVQERNTYATNVWKRIKMKLDGKDPDPSKKASIAEQIDFVIKEATHLENLAALYEGWTPWV